MAVQTHPESTPAALPQRPDLRVVDARRRAAELHLITYVVGIALFWTLWAAISVTADRWYWWPIVPFVGWALVLAAHLRRVYRPRAATGFGERQSMRGAGLSRREGRVPKVVIVGGGMGGMAAARKLARAPVEVTLVDARNYYLFQPLIYEVAGAILNVEDITHSIRGLLRGQRNARVRLATAVGADLERHDLVLADGERLRFDYLILSAGLRSDVERVPGAATYAFPLKTLDDAVRLRNHVLRRLETAAAHPELAPAGVLDIVIVGGGTTGVEVAAAFTEIYNHALRGEFPELDFSHATITVLEAGDALLSAFHPKLQQSALRMLTKRGAEVRFRAQVAEVGPASVTLTDGSELAAGTVVWATGVRATPLANALGAPQTPDGRALVSPNLSLPGHPDVFAIGDMAALPRAAGGLHPALAQFAIQGGRHAAREIVRQLAGKPGRPFHYWDKGMTSMVGRNAAVVQSGRLRLSGRLAFFFWGFLHGLYVPGLRNRLSVSLTWIWSYATRRRAALLLIDEPSPPGEPPARTTPLNAEERVGRRRQPRPNRAAEQTWDACDGSEGGGRSVH